MSGARNGTRSKAMPSGPSTRVVLSNSSGNTIGGTAPGTRNFISGFSNFGVQISGQSTLNTVVGNAIGLDQGFYLHGNGGGVLIDGGAFDNEIGAEGGFGNA